jgi:Ca2+-binding EF-hand superfamily protein
MLKLPIQLKFPDQAEGKKNKTEGNAFIDAEVRSHDLTIGEILSEIRGLDTFVRQLEQHQLKAEDVNVRLLCQGKLLCESRKLSDDADGKQYLRMLQSANAFTQVDEVDGTLQRCGAKAPVVLKISFRTSHVSPPMPLLPSSDCGEAFLDFLTQTNSLLLPDFEKSNFEDTDLYRYAFRKAHLQFTGAEPPVDAIEHCISELSKLKERHDEHEAKRKLLIKEELDTQKDAFEIGKVRELDRKLFPQPKWHPTAVSQAADPPERMMTKKDKDKGKAKKDDCWPWDLRLHHKLHDMLMFDIAELELDGKPYTGKSQDPKRDQKKPDKDAALLKKAFTAALKHGSSTIELGQVLEIVKKEFACEANQEEFVRALLEALLEIDAGPSGAIDETKFMELVKKLKSKRLSSVKKRLEHMISEAKGLGCPNVEGHLDKALKAADALLNPLANDDCWFSKTNAYYNLEDIMYCWRNSSRQKKVMPLPLHSLCKQAFAEALILTKSCSSITLSQVLSIVKEFASEANETEYAALVQQVQASPNDTIDEAKFFELVKKLQPKVGVQDVVEFYDRLVKIEKQRKECGKPPKLEFFHLSDKDKRSLDLHRIIGAEFDGQFNVRCAPMLVSIRADYSAKNKVIQEALDENEKERKRIKSNMGVLCSFLFILARARMHHTFEAFDPEVAATSSLGIVGIKTFRNFITKSVLEAEQLAYSDLGLVDIMRKIMSAKERSVCSDRHQLQIRFRQLCYQGLTCFSSKDVKFLKQPFSRLRKIQKTSVDESKLEMSPSGEQVFSVATVMHSKYCAVCSFSHMRPFCAVQRAVSNNRNEKIQRF